MVQTLPINLVLAWKMRHKVTFVVADLNEQPEWEMTAVYDACKAAINAGMLKRYRRHVPETDGFTHWHASVGKNCAHVAAISAANLNDGERVVLVELDNDNFVSQHFFNDLVNNAEAMVNGKITCLRWRHPNCPPTVGRTVIRSVACPRSNSSWLLCWCGLTI